jgi:hypothetical protein
MNDNTAHNLAPKLIGLRVRLDIGTPRRCCGYPANIAVVTRGTGSHFANLNCLGCGAVRGALTEQTASAIAAIIATFGKPNDPIILRRKPEQHFHASA